MSDRKWVRCCVVLQNGQEICCSLLKSYPSPPLEASGGPASVIVSCRFGRGPRPPHILRAVHRAWIPDGDRSGWEMQEAVGLCSRFRLEKVANGRLSVVHVGRNRADGPECWDRSSGPSEGTARPLLPTIPSGRWLQVLPKQAQSRRWRDAGGDVRAV
jgi:hypothetical protein